jgi:hypothetical protein
MSTSGSGVAPGPATDRAADDGAAWWASPDDVIWDRKAKQLRYEGLAPLQDKADRWAGSIAAILGIFGTVAFVTGPDTFEKLDPAIAGWVLLLIGAAALSAGLALGLAAYAAQGGPRWFDELDGDALRDETLAAARRAVDNLFLSRWLTIVAAATLLLAMGLVFWSSLPNGNPSATGKPALVVTTSGEVTCHRLGPGPAGALELMDTAGSPQPLPPRVASVSFVDCPLSTK